MHLVVHYFLRGKKKSKNPVEMRKKKRIRKGLTKQTESDLSCKEENLEKHYKTNPQNIKS